MTTEAFTTEPDNPADLSVLHRRVIESARALMNTGLMVEMRDIAEHAWNRMTEQERAEALPELLASYVSRVAYEESKRVYEREAADPNVNSYLRPHDVPMLWAAHDDPNGGPDQAIVDRGALLRLLCEDELLRHRLDMTRGGDAPAAK